MKMDKVNNVKTIETKTKVVWKLQTVEVLAYKKPTEIMSTPYARSFGRTYVGKPRERERDRETEWQRERERVREIRHNNGIITMGSSFSAAD